MQMTLERKQNIHTVLACSALLPYVAFIPGPLRSIGDYWREFIRQLTGNKIFNTSLTARALLRFPNGWGVSILAVHPEFTINDPALEIGLIREGVFLQDCDVVQGLTPEQVIAIGCLMKDMPISTPPEEVRNQICELVEWISDQLGEYNS